MRSFKVVSRLCNVLVFVCGLVTFMGQDALASILPVGYVKFAPIIVMVAGYIVVQLTEDRRVVVAEDLIRQEYTPNPQETVLNDEYEVINDGQ